ncbi:unnamed protein product [Durusdinium trenchii]|uniref:Uncharacterized protein n=2 Tax=Durusdinium trenchii TaxID=1381693 RepID=A0ABP0SNK1_9DINO
MPNSFGAPCSLALVLCLCVGALGVRPVTDTDAIEAKQMEEHPIEKTKSAEDKNSHALPEATLWREFGAEEHHVFKANALAFQNLDQSEQWRLYASSNCSAEEVTSFYITIYMSQTDPVHQSNVTLHVDKNLPWDTDILYAGAQGLGRCLVFLRRPPPDAPVIEMLKKLPTVFQDRRLHAFLALRKDARIHFEVAFALVVLLGAVILVWSLRITVKALKDRRHSWGLTDESDFSQSQLRPPQAAEILKRAFANIVYFLLGCALFVVEGQRFFRKNLDDSGTGYIMVLVFPLLFGCAGVLRIFMAAARSHLYFSSLRHGLLLELRVVKLSGDLMLLWMWVGIILTLGRAMQVVFAHRGIAMEFEDLKALGLLASPVFYMKKSTSDMLAIEDMAMNRECKIGLEGISDRNFVQLGDAKGIRPMSESAFLALARHRKEIHVGSGLESIWVL